MKFGPLSLEEAEGAVLAHSMALPGGRLKKGRTLTAADIATLRSAGEASVVAARLGPEDVEEDAAAARIAAAIAAEPAVLGLTVSAPFTGRVNLFADHPGLLELDEDVLAGLNGLDEAITVATLAPWARVAQRQMVATVKIIPYAAPAAAVAEAERRAAGARLLHVRPVVRRTAGLVLTRTPGMSDTIVEKGAKAVRTRLAGLGMTLAEERIVPHREAEIREVLPTLPGDLVLLMTASATSDRNDVAPAAVVAAGGRLDRFGMPVDPGNLLFLGSLSDRPVIGLPGCARSPKLNGADWVLERVACGVEVDSAAIAAMAAGGLLKEIPSRPSPRTGEGHATVPARPRISALILAAGSSRRMRGRDKLLEPVGGRPVLARVAEAALESSADETLVVLRPDDAARQAALAGLGVTTAESPRFEEGMGASLAHGLTAIRPDADGVLILLADMPEIGSAEIDRLIAAFDPEEGRAIVRATTPDGTPGHPVLFGRRFFEALAALGGDRGARELIRDNGEFLAEVALPRRAAVTDLDTPEAWAAWRAEPA